MDYIQTILNDLVDDLFNDEDNFNNCDKTSNQRVYTEAEIKQYIKKAVKEW